MNPVSPLMIRNVTIYAETGKIAPGYIELVDGKIKNFGPMNQMPDPKGVQVIELSEAHRIIPGMIDVHIHGAGGADTMDATVEALDTMAVHLAKEGTTSFLATTITQSHDNIEAALVNAAHYIEQHQAPGKAECVGVHLEGPFINKKRAGAQPPEYIVNPDREQFAKWQEMARGWIRLVTLAPEEPGGLELTRYLKETGVIASIGHSDACYHHVAEAIDAGLSHVTHLFNGMRGFHHREPGVAGAALLRDELMVEMIVDGIHIERNSVKVAYKQLTSERIVLITDSMRAKCLKSGTYDLGGQEVTVTETDARLADGTLAGSILKMKDAFKNMHHFVDCSIEQLIQMTAGNAAKELKLDDRKGSIAVGKDADIVVLDENLEVMMTICRGAIAYQAKEQ
ncbi:N-acetylglucosamine-6-phosphate deacetylase [Laceyella putida]|uniref:N-acetylglucosamine-6-phosphate deacetylase n=1 Tax=Laceyella putida TaxID=110101 RepID=A0ABW2RKC0_9BACL